MLNKNCGYAPAWVMAKRFILLSGTHRQRYFYDGFSSVTHNFFIEKYEFVMFLFMNNLLKNYKFGPYTRGVMSGVWPVSAHVLSRFCQPGVRAGHAAKARNSDALL